MKRTRQEKIRLGFIFVLVSLFFTIAAARLVHLQIFQSNRYSAIVQRQSSSTVTVPAERGVIHDRNGQLVAKNVIAQSLYAYPDDPKELQLASAYLDKFFALKSGTAAKKFRLEVRKFSWIQRRMSDQAADRVEADAPRGLFLREETCRAYPYGTVGKQILGFTDIDNLGQSGLELSMDSLLSGKPGTADVRRDGLRNTYRVNETALVKPKPGRSVVLSVDWRLQEVVETEIRAAVEKHNAKSAMAVFVDCRTGDILAAAHYDPSEDMTSKPTKLRAITDQFEPGSVFKAFTAASLLDAAIINFQDSVFCEEGRWRIGRRTLHDDKELGWLSFREVIVLSSNIGMGKLALQLPPDELFEAYRRFGFGMKTRSGLPGETAGRLTRPARWSDYNVAALAMGHSVAVSPLQLAMAMGAIANGGNLMQPRFVIGGVDDDGRIVSVTEPQVICRAMEESSIDSLRSFLRGVVETGTATAVNSPVVSIAGKTGTAEIPNLETGGYYKNRFNASFLGYFPAEAPVVAGVVVVKDPRPVTYGGYTAGPAFRRIAECYTVLNPDAFISNDRMLLAQNNRLENTVKVPSLIGRDIAIARKMVEEKGIRLRASATEGIVTWQFPPADRILFDGDELLVTLSPSSQGDRAMTDLRGMSIRAVAAFMHEVGLPYRIKGTGLVVTQSIKPGTLIRPGLATCELVCRKT